MPLAPGQTLKNRYRIETLLGQGGMGAVYRARDMSLDIPVAVKENFDTSPEAQKQFEREAKILANLSHPSLPRVTDYFFVPGQGQYLVMDYIEGEDLSKMLNRLGALPESKVVPWIMQVCDALSYLHSQPSPIIHRDIKPANIKIRPDGRAMLVDFGIAKVYAPYLATTIGAKAVTPGYSPPEQYGGGTTDPRSDVYSVGATLYHLLTGQKPPESLQRMVGSVSAPSPRQLNPQISPSTEQTILKAIEVITDRRFQRVDELRTALTQSLTQSAQGKISAQPPASPTVRRPIGETPRPAQPARKSNLATPILLLIASALGLSFIGCVIFLAFLQSSGAQSRKATEAAITAQAQADASTATAQAQATEAAQAQAAATAQARATREAQPLELGSQWPSVIFDSFDDNTYGWSSGDSDSEWAAHHITINGTYNWAITAHKDVFSWVVPKIDPVTDFYLSAQAQKISGPDNSKYGLMFRQSGDDKYTFLTSGTMYYFGVYAGGAWTTLINWTSTSAIQPDQVNQLAVVAQGSHFTFYINGTYVDEADDSSLSSGKPGLAVELKAGDDAVFEFDDFEVHAP